MVTRNIGGQSCTLTYNADGRLVTVSGPSGFSAAFAYDGDGQRVKQVINGATTYFVGNYYEKTGTTITKYYYAGATRIAIRTDSTLTYLLGDHLGSTSVVTDSSGTLLVETRYKPFGEVRYATAGMTLPTRYTFTGQYSYVSDEATDAAGFGLIYFNARWLDPGLGRFAQADTIIPGAGNPQAWDRYAFVYNNPLQYTDPTGHNPVIGFLTGLLKELARTNFWFHPGYQKDLAIRGNESDAELLGRLTADIASVALGAVEVGVGGTAAGGGILACATGVGCPLGGLEAIAAGAVLAGQGVGTGARAAEGMGTILAAFGKRSSGSDTWGTHSGKQPRIIKGYKVRVDWESPGDNGNVHVTVDGVKIEIEDPSDLSALPKGLRDNGWIRQQLDRAFAQLIKFEQSNSGGR
jgi:RHS repeat-associated protein